MTANLRLTIRCLVVALVAVVSVSCGGSDEGAQPAETPASTVEASAPSSMPATSRTAETPTTDAPTSTRGTIPPSSTAAEPTSVQGAGVACTPISFPSGGSDLPAERCELADGTGLHAGAVIVGGCESDEADQLLKQSVARSLAADGVTVLVVNYHAAAPAPPGTLCEPSEAALAALPATMGAVSDAAAWLRTDPDVSGGPVAAVGYSLGGLLAAWADIGGGLGVSVSPADFAAIAMFSSPMFPDVLDAARAGQLPPLYVVHGDADDTVSVDDSRQIAQATTAGGTEMTLVIAPQMDHGWSGTTPMQTQSREEAIPAITEFIVATLADAR